MLTRKNVSACGTRTEFAQSAMKPGTVSTQHLWTCFRSLLIDLTWCRLTTRQRPSWLLGGMAISFLEWTPGPGFEIFAENREYLVKRRELENFGRVPIEVLLRDFPSSLILAGPAGSGKSFAIRSYLARCGEALQEWALTDNCGAQLPPMAAAFFALHQPIFLLV